MGVLVVTGGGRGIGAAVCRQVAAAGYQVVINYASDESSARAVLAEIEAVGGSGLTVAGDVASEQDVARIFAAADTLGPLSGLVSNAGVTGNTPGRLDEQDAGVVRRVLDVNVLGVFLCNREAVRRMSTRYGGTGGAIA